MGFRTTVSDSVEQLEGEFLILKPRRGGAAFWRSLLSFVADDAEFSIIALRLHSRAWIYIIPSDVKKYGYFGENLSILRVSGKLDLSDWEEKKVINAKVRHEKVKVWWGTTYVKYIEVCSEEGCYRVYRNYKEKEYVESGTESETEAASSTDSDSIANRIRF